MRFSFIKVFLLLLCVQGVSVSFAQFKVGVFGGPQITSAKYTVREAKQPTEAKYSAQFGALMKVPFENQLYFAPALYYSQKGYKVTLNQPAFPPSELAVNNDTRIHTVEAAALVNYDFSKMPSHFFIKGGFAADLAFSGKEKFDTKTDGPVSRDMVFSFADYGRITASANIHFGYEWASGVFVFAQYAHGIGSLNNADGGPIIKHRIAGISAGYYLHGR